MKPRYCIGQVVYTDGNIEHVIYRSPYPLGTHGNFLDFSWFASMRGIDHLDGLDVLSIHMRYADEKEKSEHAV